MQVPISTIKVFLSGNCLTEALTKAIRSTPNVFGVLYKFLNGNLTSELKIRTSKYFFACSI